MAFAAYPHNTCTLCMAFFPGHRCIDPLNCQHAKAQKKAESKPKLPEPMTDLEFRKMEVPNRLYGVRTTWNGEAV